MIAKIKLWRGIAPMLCILCLAGAVFAQSGSANYRVTAGYLVGGGATSASATYKAVGMVPLTGCGYASSTNFKDFGGIIAATFSIAGFSASYAGASVQTVPLAAVTLKVAYIGGTGTATGTFYHRSGGQTIYVSTAMTAGTGDTLIAAVGADMLGGLRGMEYYLKIDRGGISAYIGSSAVPYVFRTQLTDAQAQSPAMPDAQYRIIGVPIVPSNSNLFYVFADNLGTPDPIQWRLGRYVATGDSVVPYPNSGGVAPGRGYWLIARGGKTFGSDGVSVRPNREYDGIDYYQVPLDSGWNMVANPFPFAINWSAIRFDTSGTVVPGHPAAVLDDAAYSYTGSAYSSATSINPWYGVFIRAKRTGVRILYPYIQAGLKAPMAPREEIASSSPADWTVELALTAGGLSDVDNRAGVGNGALTGEDDYDFSEPPPAPGGPRLAFRLPENCPDLKRIDLRPPFADGAAWDLVITKASNRQLRVTGIADIPKGMQARLVRDDGATTNLTDGMTITLPDNVETARLLIGTEDYLAGKITPLPTEYSLSQNSPNPFNPSTVIRYALPKPGKVHLDILNILGQTVKTLIDGDIPAGYHSITWNGDDADGHAMASGIYFYRLRAGEFARSRKMVLLK